MADDLAAQLARAFTLAAGRMLPTSSYQPSKVTELLAGDLRRILPDLTRAAYDAGRRDEWLAGFSPEEPAGRPAVSMVPVEHVVPGMLVDDERWPDALRVGHVTLGPEWVTLRAFDPRSGASANPTRRVHRGASVQVATR